MKNSATFAISLLAGLALSACVSSDTDSDGLITVQGTAAYRERVALPPRAVMTTRVQDISRADARATVIGEQRIALEGRQVPVSFSIQVPAAALESAVRASTRVRIVDGDGQLIWTTDQIYPVATPQNGSVVDLGQLGLVSARR